MAITKELLLELQEAHCRRLIDEISDTKSLPAWGTIVNAFLSQNKVVVGEEKEDAIDELRKQAEIRANRKKGRFKDNPSNTSNIVPIKTGT